MSLHWLLAAISVLTTLQEALGLDISGCTAQAKHYVAPNGNCYAFLAEGEDFGEAKATCEGVGAFPPVFYNDIALMNNVTENLYKPSKTVATEGYWVSLLQNQNKTIATTPWEGWYWLRKDGSQLPISYPKGAGPWHSTKPSDTDGTGTYNDEDGDQDYAIVSTFLDGFLNDHSDVANNVATVCEWSQAPAACSNGISSSFVVRRGKKATGGVVVRSEQVPLGGVLFCATHCHNDAMCASFNLDASGQCDLIADSSPALQDDPTYASGSIDCS